MENTNQKGGNSQVAKQFDWKNKNLWLGVAAVLVVVLLIVVLSKRGNKEVEAPLETNNETTETVTKDEPTKPVSGRRAAAAKDKVAPTAPKMSYAEALVRYKDFRIQFDANCQATPKNSTYPNGTEIMIDNRSAVNRNFVIGSTFTVAPYDFKIMKVSSNVLPYNYLVDCGVQQNVATILVQR